MDITIKHKLIAWLINSAWWNEIKHDIYMLLAVEASQ